MGSCCGKDIEKIQLKSFLTLYTKEINLESTPESSLSLFISPNDLGGNKVLVKKFPLKTQSQSHLLAKELNEKTSLVHENLAKVCCFSIVKTSSFSGGFEVRIAFEYFDKTLRGEIFRRSKHSEGPSYYSEKDIRTLLKSLTKACLALESIGYPHRAIMPSNIQFNDFKTVKLADDLVTKKLRKVRNQKAFDKSRMMRGIGLTVLCAAVLGDFVEVYGANQFSTLKPIILNKIQQMKELNYSEELVSIVAGCLSAGSSQFVSLMDLEQEIIGMYEGERTSLGVSGSGFKGRKGKWSKWENEIKGLQWSSMPYDSGSKESGMRLSNPLELSPEKNKREKRDEVVVAPFSLVVPSTPAKN